MRDKLKKFAPLIAAAVLLPMGLFAAPVIAQTVLPNPGDRGVWCPDGTFVEGDKLCKQLVWPSPSTVTYTETKTVTVAPTTTTTSVTPTTTSVVPTTTTVAPTTTTQPPVTGVRKGWELTAQNIGLAAQGLVCDQLEPYTGPQRPARGTTIYRKKITVPLNLYNGDITIDQSCVKPTNVGEHNDYLVTTTDCSAACKASTVGNVVIKDSEINGSALPTDASLGGSDGFIGVAKLYRNYLHSMGSGIAFFETGTVHDAYAENNYVRGLRHTGEAHHDGATIRDFRKNAANTRTVKFIGNRLDSTPTTTNEWQTGALFIQPTWVDIYNGTVQDNYLEGGGYNLRLMNAGGIYGNMKSINNRFRPTEYGPSATDSGFGWGTWTNNFRYCANCTDFRGTAVSP